MWPVTTGWARIISDQVLDVFVVFLADVFDELAAEQEGCVVNDQGFENVFGSSIIFSISRCP